MKKALLIALSLTFLLTACDETTLPDTSEQNPVYDAEAAPTAVHVYDGGEIVDLMD